MLLLAACGGDGTPATTEAAATTGAQPATTAGPVTAPGGATKPEVTIPETPPPDTLLVEDITEGTGKEAVAGLKVTVHYVGVGYSTKQEFDASWNRGRPFTFELGTGRVIKGWDQGVAGMKVGGRRRLTIPGDLAYGTTGRPPSILPNETLVFVVDLLEVS